MRQDGDAVVLEPARPKSWPEGFFDTIHITDPAFERSDQGQLPPAKPGRGQSRIIECAELTPAVSTSVGGSAASLGDVIICVRHKSNLRVRPLMPLVGAERTSNG